jgi:hypothetical protein
MTDTPPASRIFRERPALTQQAEAARKARADREAAALRANLRRRKEQARARDVDNGGEAPEGAPRRP